MPARRTSSRSGQDARALRIGLVFVSPWIIGFLIFTLYPILASLYYSFCQYRVLTPPHWVGVRNYVDLFTDREYFLQSLWNTCFMFLELPLSLVFGLAIALLLNQKLKGMAWFRTLYYLPSVVPTVASSILWLWLLNPEYGLVNKTLQVFHIQTTAWLADRMWAKPGFIVMDLWSVGGGMVIYLASLQGVPQHLYEAAELDGASPWQKLLNVTLPSISPVIFFNLILGVIGTFQYFTQAFVMTGSNGNAGGPANSTLFYALYLYQNAFQYFRMGYACAMAWVLFVITLVAALIVFRTSARWVYYEGGGR
ncbi:MAG: sugar ABC transporter permease [Armatimonadetes bacterium]|nr:sugar ABC transporter permease [Armatimonadota bacterium]MDE2206556.1 sugar ABC transporter permease [Armatimonadota bacterium]